MPRLRRSISAVLVSRPDGRAYPLPALRASKCIYSRLRPYGRSYFLSPFRGSTSDEPWILTSPHMLQITSPGAKRRQRVAPAVRPGNIVSIKMSAEGAAPFIHTPISESRLNPRLGNTRGWWRRREEGFISEYASPCVSRQWHAGEPCLLGLNRLSLPQDRLQ